jgi:aryl-alcohol dehydrogenase-like predicted oxidoreductase
MKKNSKIIIGGAQVGMNYGISNKIGEIPNSSLLKILKYCHSASIKYIDTATAYNRSIKKLEYCINKLKLQAYFRFIIKVSEKDLNDLKKKINLFFKKNYFYCLMAHSSKVFFDERFQELIKICNKKKVKIGVSIYDNRELIKLSRFFCKINVIQIPYNLLNFREFNEKLMKKAKKNKIEFHARSVFHQGFFYLPNNFILKKYPKFYKNYIFLKKKFETKDLSIDKISLKFVLCNKYINKIILGIDNLIQLKKNLKVINSEKLDFNFNKKIIDQFFIKNVPDPRSF